MSGAFALLALALAAPAVKQSAWIESDLYDLKVRAVVHCGQSGRGIDASMTHLGVDIKVRSKTASLFVAPRDVSLQDRGFLFRSIPDPELTNCKPALKPTPIRRGREIGGFVVFQVPARTEAMVLEYSPTRWGGASKVRVPIQRK